MNFGLKIYADNLSSIVFISSFIINNNWYKRRMKKFNNIQLTALIVKPTKAKNRNLEARRNFQSDFKSWFIPER